MTTDQTLSPALLPLPSAESRRRLAEAIEPGRRRLEAAGALQSIAIVVTAAGFLAIAAIAQDVLNRHSNWPRDRRWLLLLAGSAIARAGASYLAARQASNGALLVEHSLRDRLLRRLILGNGSPLPSAAQATAVMDEVERVGAYAERYHPARVATILVPAVLLVAVFTHSWVVAAILLLCAPLPPLNLSIVGMGTATVAQQHAEELRHLSGYFLDRLRGLATLKALGAEHAELDRVSDASQRLAASSMAVLRVAFVSAAVLEAIVTLAIAVVAIYIGLTLLGYVQVPGLPSHMSLQTGLFLLMITPLYFQPVRTLAAAYHERADALAAIGALGPLLDVESDPGRPAAAPSLVRPPAIETDRLTVVFPGRELPALDAVSFAIRPGELVGLTGVSGAGKSTLLRVLARDLEPATGGALLDGVPPGQVARTSITWLGQRPYLFAGTIQENIALARPDATEFAVMHAAVAAGLGAVLDRLPDGLDTPVGESGWGLSGGEAHRVALARAFLARALLLLLDEPTAHLDAVSEAAIIEIIRSTARSATTVVASHSPAVLAACDRVITLDRGRFIQAPSTPRLAEVAA